MKTNASRMFFRRWFSWKRAAPRDKDPGEAYDQWSASYDDQPGNLMLDMEKRVFAGLLTGVDIEGRTIVDFGCGTGRQWPQVLVRNPEKLVGYDVSAGMLRKLKEKFPAATVFHLLDNKMPEQANNSADIIVSTLTLAHLENPVAVFQEWNRVLKTGSDIIITDYHPRMLEKGGKRTFLHDGKTISVKNYVHSIRFIREQAGQLGWTEIRYIEKILDTSLMHYYEIKNAMPVFNKFRGLPFIYGIHFKKD